MEALACICGIGVVGIVSYRSYHKHSLSLDGALTAALVGSLHILAGWRYAVLLLFFFVTSSKLTKMGSSIKRKREERYVFGGERRSIQVISNSFIPSWICIYVILCKAGILSTGSNVLQLQQNVLLLPTTLSYYCECCADTWGSEVGILSNHPYLLLLPWRPVPAGTNGGLSLLGMSAALTSSVVLSLLYSLIQPSTLPMSFSMILSVTLFSSIAGTFIDSAFGAFFERSWWCSSKGQILSHTSSLSNCCRVAEKDHSVVQGHTPDRCGLVCGRSVLSGSMVNLLASSLTSLCSFIWLYLFEYLRVCCFIAIKSISTIMQSPKDRSVNSSLGVNFLALIIWAILLIALLCGLYGIVMLFYKTDRIERINKYNAAVDEWNAEGYLEMNDTRFVVSFNEYRKELDHGTSGYGLFYPYRDGCDKKNDPECKYAGASHFYGVIPWSAIPAKFQVYTYDNYSLYSDTVNGIEYVLAEKKDINCIGGSVVTCSNECMRRGGVWNTDLFLCNITGYLHSISLRIKLDNSSFLWSVDDPPMRLLHGSPTDIGDTYSYEDDIFNYNNLTYWRRYHYSTSPSSNITIQVRHYQDPYIIASSVTEGCSSSSLDNQYCFGRAKEDIMQNAMSLLYIGGGSLVFLLLIWVAYHYRAKLPSWVRRIYMIRIKANTVQSDEVKSKLMKSEVNDELDDSLLCQQTVGKQERSNSVCSPLLPSQILHDIPTLPTDIERQVSVFQLNTAYTGDDQGIYSYLLNKQDINEATY